MVTITKEPCLPKIREIYYFVKICNGFRMHGSTGIHLGSETIVFASDPKMLVFVHHRAFIGEIRKIRIRIRSFSLRFGSNCKGKKLKVKLFILHSTEGYTLVWPMRIIPPTDKSKKGFHCLWLSQDPYGYTQTTVLTICKKGEHFWGEWNSLSRACTELYRARHISKHDKCICYVKFLAE